MTTPSDLDNGTGTNSNDTSGSRGTLSRVKDSVAGMWNGEVTARQFTDDERVRVHDTVIDGLAEGDGRLLRIKPSPDGQGVRGGVELFEKLVKSFSRRGMFGIRNASPVQSFEVWMEGDEVTFNVFVQNDACERTLLTELDADYPGAKVDTVWEASSVRSFLSRQVEDGEYDSRGDVPLPDEQVPFLPVSDARYIAAASFEMQNPRVYPIRAEDDADEEEAIREKEDGYIPSNDPYKSIISSMTADARNHCVLQVTYRPAKERWADKWWWYHAPNWFRVSVDDVVEKYSKSDEVAVGRQPRDKTHKEKKFADRVENRADTPGFQVSMRVVSVGTDKTTVESLVREVSSSIESKFEGRKQSFVSTPRSGSGLLQCVDDCVTRDLNEVLHLSLGEFGAVAHLPNSDVDSSLVAWQRGVVGNRIPAGVERIGEVDSESSAFPLNRKPERIPPDPSRFEKGREGGGLDSVGESTGVDGVQSSEDSRPSSDDVSGGASAGGSDDHVAPGSKTDLQAQSESGQEQTHGESDEGEEYPGWLRNKIQADDLSDVVLYCENQSVWVSVPRYVFGGVSSLLGVFVTMLAINAMSGSSELPGVSPRTGLGIGIGVFVLGVGVAWYERIRRQHRWHVATVQGVYKKTGIVSRDADKLPRKQIHQYEREVSKAAGLLMRVTGSRSAFATIGVGSAATDGNETTFTWVKYPDELRDVIEGLTGPERENEDEDNDS